MSSLARPSLTRITNVDACLDAARRCIRQEAYHAGFNPNLLAAAASLSGPKYPAIRGRVREAILDATDNTLHRWKMTPSVIPRHVSPAPKRSVSHGERMIPSVSVSSAHLMFSGAPEWWLASMAWTITLGVRIDASLDDINFGNRLHETCLRDPSSAVRVFKDFRSEYEKWKEGLVERALELHKSGQDFAVVGFDFADYYYSASELPSKIVRSLALSPSRPNALERGLTRILDSLHLRFASSMEGLPDVVQRNGPGHTPFPVGLPSSSILGNAGLARLDRALVQDETVEIHARYVDDVRVLVKLTPENHTVTPGDPASTLVRLVPGLDLTDGGEAAAARTDAGMFSVQPSKIAVSLYFPVPSPPDSGTDRSAESNIRDDLFGSAPPSTGEMTTMLGLDPKIGAPGTGPRTAIQADARTPGRTYELDKDLGSLRDGVKAGIDLAELRRKSKAIAGRTDPAVAVASHGSWTELVALLASSTTIEDVTNFIGYLEDVCHVTHFQDGENEDATALVRSALTDALDWAIGQACALGAPTSAWVRHALEAGTGHAGTTRLRRRRRADLRSANLFPHELVRVPALNFTGYSGDLADPKLLSRFMKGELDCGDVNRGALQDSPRFVHLHEISLHRQFRLIGQAAREGTLATTNAGDIWGNASTDRDVFNEQPSTSQRQRRADEVVATELRVGLPVFRVRGESYKIGQLRSDPNLGLTSKDHDRRRIWRILFEAKRQDVDLLVFPEWSVPVGMIQQICRFAATNQMFIVMSLSPFHVGRVYMNMICSAIPGETAAGDRFAEISMLRPKGHLSPAEHDQVQDAGMVAPPKQEIGHTTRWRGAEIASLICFEAADVRARGVLHDTAEIVTASLLNRDYTYFDAVQLSLTRDSYLFTVFSNTSSYRGTCMMQPTSGWSSTLLAAQGGTKESVVSAPIDLEVLRAIRAGTVRTGLSKPEKGPDRRSNLERRAQYFKPLPPGLR